MRNTKEIRAILTAICVINRTSNHPDPDIDKIVDYAFRSCLGANTNLLTLYCIGRNKEDVLPDVLHLLDEETNYTEYMEAYSK